MQRRQAMTMFRYAALPAVFMLIGCASSWTPRSEGAALDQFAEIGLVIHASDRVVSQFMEIVFSDDPAALNRNLDNPQTSARSCFGLRGAT